MNETTVMVVDDHRMFAELLARQLDDFEDISVIATATSGDEALSLLDRLAPDVLLLDRHMPGRDGLEVAGVVRRTNPKITMIMMSGADTNQSIVDAIAAGCSGFLSKTETVDDVAAAVREAVQGMVSISSSLMAALLPTLRTPRAPCALDLTPRELVTLQHLADGLTNQAIAVRMGITTNTVRNFVQSILTKLGAHSKLEAVSIARRRGLLEPPAVGAGTTRAVATL